MCLIMKEDCIFCKIAKGEIHSATVYEDSHFTVILDVNPATKGHCLIIPKEHFDNIYDLDGETAGKLFALATCIARAMRDALKCDGLNLVQNNGEIAGQTVNHFHLHLIPRYEGDGLNLNWPQQEISAEQLEEIRPVCSNLSISLPERTPQKSVAFAIFSVVRFTTNSPVSCNAL